MGNINFNETTTSNILELVKINLGISTTAYDGAITNDIKYARTELSNKGLILDETVTADAYIVVMYVIWLWRGRETGAEMPRMLVVAINDRFTHQVMSNGTEGA